MREGSAEARAPLTEAEYLEGMRPVTMEHAARYGEIYAAAFSGEPWNDPWDPKDAEIHVRELLESKQSYGLEYVLDGKVAGFILGTSMLFHYGRVFEINDLAVDPACQGRGIAKTLLERCLSEMKKRGMAGVNLITEAEGFLPGFYEKYGFSREDRVILMGKEL
jgi:ribosomal protein S18 acetylase RimI-like enzyme